MGPSQSNKCEHVLYSMSLAFLSNDLKGLHVSTTLFFFPDWCIHVMYNIICLNGEKTGTELCRPREELYVDSTL